MNEKSRSSKAKWLLIIVPVVIIIPIIAAVAAWRYTPADTVDYKGTFVNTAGDKFDAEICTHNDLQKKSFITLSDEKGRTAVYRVHFADPEKALPKDIRVIDTDTDSYIIWVCKNDGGESIFYTGEGNIHENFSKDHEVNSVSEYMITAIDDIEESGALDGLPDEGYINEWRSYFSKLKQEYQNSSKTVSKEDSV